MKTIAFLPAKGSSSRIENKNLSLLDGKPLFLHTLEKIMQPGLFDDVYLDTDSDEIIELAEHIPCKILKRDKRLASNATDGNKLFMNEVAHADADVYVQILCTSPFISTSTIESGISRIAGSDEFDSAFLTRRERQYVWRHGQAAYNIDAIPNSSDLQETLIETMGLYIIKKEAALRFNRRIGEKPLFLEASPIESVDVNWPEDFALASLIAAGLREDRSKLLQNVKARSSSAILSDVMDDLGYSDQVIGGLQPNKPGIKLLGRAKTLKLRELGDGEDYRGIYDAYKSYEAIIPNDIIVVESATPDYAYFGELNANLAIRAGAAGTILNCKTRDNSAVSALNFPVFSTGFIAQDVRKRATVESMNKPITLCGVIVDPGNLLFADSDGIVVIPKEIEERALEELSSRLTNEDRILSGIARGEPISDLISKYGNF